jgi:hypothetical protein
MKPPRFGPALSWLQTILAAASRELQTTVRSALIGGLSVAAWGAVRATQDIDLLADSDPSPIGDPGLRVKLGQYFTRQRCRVDWRVGDYDDPIPLLLRLELPRAYGGLSADVLWAHKRWQRDALMRSITVSVSRRRVRVLHPEDLILLKLDAGGPQDLADVEGLLTNPPQQLNLARLKEAATRLRLGRLLEKCLRNVSGGS